MQVGTYLPTYSIVKCLIWVGKRGIANTKVTESLVLEMANIQQIHVLICVMCVYLLYKYVHIVVGTSRRNLNCIDLNFNIAIYH